MAKLFKTTFKLRRGSSEAWDKNNPILAYGEPGFDKDQYIFKIGDGSKNWRDLKPIGAITNEDIDARVEIHNESTVAHNDIRALIQQLSNRLNLLANSDDVTLDQMNEIVTYIKNNKSLIDSITTAKVNISDIINDLVTNVSNKPLSAAQGVKLKELIDSLEKTLENYALKSDIKEAPVQSVNGQTGNVEITVDSIGAQPAGNYALQSDIDNLGKLSKKDTVEKSDFASDVQTSLNKADTALQSYTETDPTVPAWAKEATKPTYTASEVGALPDTTEIPSIEGLASEEYVDDKIAAIPTPDVSGQIDTHNASTDAHANMGWLTSEDEIVDYPVPIDADTLGGRSASYFEDKIAEIKNNNTVSSCIKGSGAPTESTVADVGFFYMDILTGDVWKCVAVDEAVGKYTWTRLVAEEKFDPTVYGLPVLKLTGDTSTMTKDNPVDLQYVYGDRSGTASVKWQGSSSLAYPKKNYTIKFDNAFEAAPGWGEQKKYCLKANFIDHSHARNVVSAKLWGQIVKSRAISNDGVTGAIDYTGKDQSHHVFINDDTIEVTATAYLTGAILFVGQTFPAGAHTVTFEVYNPLSDYTGNQYAQLCFGIPGKENEPVLTVNVNTVEAYDTWLARSYDVEFPLDDSMIGFVIYGPLDVGENGYRFRNITVDGVPYQIESKMVSLKQLPNGGAIDGFPIVVTLNGDFHGLYTFNIPKDGWMFGMGSGEKEAIVCANTHSAPTRFWQEALMDESDFELEYASDEDNADWILPSLNTLINACINSDGTDLDTTVAQYLDWGSAIDYYIFVTLLKGGDMLDKNYLLATFNGTKWFFSAYDMDSTYGLYWNGQSIESSKGCSVVTFADSHRVMDLIRKYKTEELKRRYAKIRNTIMSEDNVALEFLNFVGLIPTVIFNEDVRKWPTIPSTASSNVAQILNWYRMRVAVIDKEIEQLKSATQFINLVPTSIDPQTGEVYNDVGYKNGVIAVAPEYGYEGNESGFVATGLISFPTYSVTSKGTQPYVSPVLYVKGNISFDDPSVNIVSYQKDGSICHQTNQNAFVNFYNIEELSAGYYKITYKTEINGSDTEVATIDNWTDKIPENVQLSMKGTGEGLIVTLNEPIK